MKVILTEVVGVGAECRVGFACDTGRGSARWVGSRPSVGESRFIELALDPAQTLGRDLVETQEPIGIRTEGGVSVLVGEVTTADRDGYVRLDIGCGAIDLEVEGSMPMLHGRYRLAAEGLKAFDANY